MSGKLLLFPLMLLFLLPVHATTIGFDEAGLVPGSPGTSLSNQFAALGVLFSSSGSVNFVSNQAFVGGVTTDGNFLVAVNSPKQAPPGNEGWPNWGVLQISFPAGAINISFSVFDTNENPSPRVIARAFNGTTFLGELGLTALDQVFTFPEASHILIEDTGADGFAIDTLSFNLVASESSVPEPGTYLLLGAGLAAIGLLRVRRISSR